MMDYFQELKPDKYYHVFNHANGNDKLFVNEGNYVFFLKKVSKYIGPIVSIYAYCLMPNHFHLMISINSESDLKRYFKELHGDKFENKLEKSGGSLGLLLSKQFSNLFSCYTQAFNKQQSRMGGLFMHGFKRIAIEDEKYLQNLAVYIHQNPVHHGFAATVNQWQFSSYHTYLSNKSSIVATDEILEYFDGKDNFKYCHKNNQVELDESIMLDYL